MPVEALLLLPELSLLKRAFCSGFSLASGCCSCQCLVGFWVHLIQPCSFSPRPMHCHEILGPACFSPSPLLCHAPALAAWPSSLCPCLPHAYPRALRGAVLAEEEFTAIVSERQENWVQKPVLCELGNCTSTFLQHPQSSRKPLSLLCLRCCKFP